MSRIYDSRDNSNDWRCTKAQGGGMLLDWRVHFIDHMMQIFRQEKLVKVCSDTILPLPTSLDRFKGSVSVVHDCTGIVVLPLRKRRTADHFRSGKKSSAGNGIGICFCTFGSGQ